MKKILFIPDNHFFRDHHTTVRYDLLNSIKNDNTKYDITIIYSDYIKNIDDINYIINIKPELVIFFDINSFRENSTKFDFLFHLNIPVYIFIEDTYYINTTKSCPYVNKTNGIIFYYKNEALKRSYKKHFPNKRIFDLDSRFVNTDIYKDYNLEKKYDILLYGSRNFYNNYKSQDLEPIQNYINKYEEFYNVKLNNESQIDIYQLRTKLENILIKHKDRYNIKICPIQGDYAYNEELSKLINQSYLTIVCSTIVDVMVFKHLEIPASKSVILGNYPSDYKELYENNIILVDEFMSEEQILNIIDEALKNKDKLLKMANELYIKVHTEHNLKKAQENFNKLLDDILS